MDHITTGGNLDKPKTSTLKTIPSSVTFNNVDEPSTFISHYKHSFCYQNIKGNQVLIGPTKISLMIFLEGVQNDPLIRNQRCQIRWLELVRYLSLSSLSKQQSEFEVVVWWGTLMGVIITCDYHSELYGGGVNQLKKGL